MWLSLSTILESTENVRKKLLQPEVVPLDTIKQIYEAGLTVMRPCSPPGEVAALRRRLLSGMRGFTKITYGLNSAVRSLFKAWSGRQTFTTKP